MSKFLLATPNGTVSVPTQVTSRGATKAFYDKDSEGKLTVPVTKGETYVGASYVADVTKVLALVVNEIDTESTQTVVNVAGVNVNASQRISSVMKAINEKAFDGFVVLDGNWIRTSQILAVSDVRGSDEEETTEEAAA